MRLSSLTYRDFEIAIIGDNDGPWYTWATYDHSRAFGRFDFTTDKNRLMDIFKKLDDGTIDGNELRNLGEDMCKSLFHDRIGSLFSKAESDLPPHIGLRIQINIQPPILNRLPWEFLYEDKFLAIHCKTPILRKIPVVRIFNEIKTSKKLKILIVISSPKDQEQLNVTREVRYIRSELGELEKQEYLELTILDSAKQEELEDALRSQFDVFHFIGHAGFDKNSQKGLIVLEDDDHNSRFYDGETLAALMSGSGVRMAIFNACDTAKSAENGYMLGVAHSILRAGIPIVVAMQFKIPDMTAVRFAKKFYMEMASGEQITTALTRARQSISGDTGIDKKDWGIPVLYATDPENLIFRPKTRLSVKPSASKKLRSSEVTNVIGICDINSLLINLEPMVNKMNSLQKYFRFEVIPGLYSVEMFRQHEDQTYYDFEKSVTQLEVLFNKYKEIGLKTIIGVTQNLIAGEGWINLFSISRKADKLSVISTYQLEDFALRANRTLEQAVIHLFLGALASIYGGLSYHDETRACLMDFCEKREDIVEGLRNPHLDESCKSMIQDRFLSSALDTLLLNISRH